MKKHPWLVGLTMVMVASGIPALAAESGTISVMNVEGNASVVRNGQEMPLSLDTKLQDGDVIRTDAGEEMDFSMNGVAGARVLPGTAIKIESSDESDMVLSLESGKVMANLKKLKPKSGFKVKTPTAIASVRGTQFLSQVETGGKEPRSTFSVRDDVVEVQRIENGTPAGESVLVEAGFSCDVLMGDIRDLNIRPATGSEVATMEQASLVRCC